MANWGKTFGDLSKKIVKSAVPMAVHGIQNTPQQPGPLHQGMQQPFAPPGEQPGGYNIPDQGPRPVQAIAPFDIPGQKGDWMQQFQEKYINGMLDWQKKFGMGGGALGQMGVTQGPESLLPGYGQPGYQQPQFPSYSQGSALGGGQQMGMQNPQFSSMSAINPYMGQIGALRGKFG